VRNRLNFGIPNNATVIIIRVGVRETDTRERDRAIRQETGISTMPDYAVRHRGGGLQEWPCLIQIEDECAAMYFNIIHGARIRKRFTTEETGKPCEDFMLLARDCRAFGVTEEREIALFELA
jgi:hypothetical protein